MPCTVLTSTLLSLPLKLSMSSATWLLKPAASACVKLFSPVATESYGSRHTGMRGDVNAHERYQLYFCMIWMHLR